MALDVSGWELMFIHGVWRYVNRQRRLATAGFRSLAATIRVPQSQYYTDDPAMMQKMAERYEIIFRHQRIADDRAAALIAKDTAHVNALENVAEKAERLHSLPTDEIEAIRAAAEYLRIRRKR